MCGRISQHVDGRIYMEALRFPAPPADDSDYAPRAPLYNIPPMTTPRVIASADGRPVMRREQWGRKGKRLYFTARLETAATNNYWLRAWRDNRIVLPVDGWYEWVGEKPNNIPYFIRRADGKPALMAAISAPDGFAIVTTNAEHGLLDLHARCPIVLEPEDASAWLDPAQTGHAEEIASRMLAAPAFEWYEVPKAVGNSRNDSPSFVEPVAT